MVRPHRIEVLPAILMVAGAGYICIGFHLGCQAQLSQADCALDAVKALPLERPEEATAGDARDAAQRFKACLLAPADGGAQ